MSSDSAKRMKFSRYSYNRQVKSPTLLPERTQDEFIQPNTNLYKAQTIRKAHKSDETDYLPSGVVSSLKSKIKSQSLYMSGHVVKSVQKNSYSKAGILQNNPSKRIESSRLISTNLAEPNSLKDSVQNKKSIAFKDTNQNLESPFSNIKSNEESILNNNTNTNNSCQKKIGDNSPIELPNNENRILTSTKISIPNTNIPPRTFSDSLGPSLYNDLSLNQSFKYPSKSSIKSEISKPPIISNTFPKKDNTKFREFKEILDKGEYSDKSKEFLIDILESSKLKERNISPIIAENSYHSVAKNYSNPSAPHRSSVNSSNFDDSIVFKEPAEKYNITYVPVSIDTINTIENNNRHDNSIISYGNLENEDKTNQNTCTNLDDKDYNVVYNTNILKQDKFENGSSEFYIGSRNISTNNVSTKKADADPLVTPETSENAPINNLLGLLNVLQSQTDSKENKPSTASTLPKSTVTTNVPKRTNFSNNAPVDLGQKQMMGAPLDMVFDLPDYSSKLSIPATNTGNQQDNSRKSKRKRKVPGTKIDKKHDISDDQVDTLKSKFELYKEWKLKTNEMGQNKNDKIDNVSNNYADRSTDFSVSEIANHNGNNSKDDCVISDNSNQNARANSGKSQPPKNKKKPKKKKAEKSKKQANNAQNEISIVGIGKKSELNMNAKSQMQHAGRRDYKHNSGGKRSREPEEKPKFVPKLLCKYVLSGSCSKGNLCTYSHDLSTISCIHYIKGSCMNGDNCKFSHDLKKVPCIHYLKGACLNGDACLYLHDPNISQNPPT
ncbi:Zinc finger CCCH domain-containing protein 7 [Smittium culicis]|uniref:Zinc finger CCCH domain-containing protein 7 n=1 Tax=Smittium culicis TaxID=133412 RepID=A0A1R1YU02_9FUNG|nr:Zinc finger CCCH domain-containing protein 7 [Smittium culicis]